MHLKRKNCNFLRKCKSCVVLLLSAIVKMIPELCRNYEDTYSNPSARCTHAHRVELPLQVTSFSGEVTASTAAAAAAAAATRTTPPGIRALFGSDYNTHTAAGSAASVVRVLQAAVVPTSNAQPSPSSRAVRGHQWTNRRSATVEPQSEVKRKLVAGM